DASKAKPRNLLAAFERARGSRGDQPAQVETAGQDRPHDARPERDSSASDDMVAAARRAAQAAAAQAAALAESREDRPARTSASPEIVVNEDASGRKRPYLIISAAILLVISALLLYGRLGSETPAELGSVPKGETVAPAEAATETTGSIKPKTQESLGQDGTGVGPTPEGTESFTIIPSPVIAPVPGMVPLHDRVGQTRPGVTDVAKSRTSKSRTNPMPESELEPAPQLASLKANEGAALPEDVVFSVEEPASATEVAMAEKLTASPVKGPMPAKEIGSDELRKAASTGNPIAQYMVAVRYIDGRGVPADAKTGAKWMKRAARSGLAPAQYRLGTMFERGVGVTADIDAARSWYLAAAERGNVKAMHNLAVSVSGGGGSTPNYALASKWYGQAALRGLADSQFNLGILAEHGLGQPKDLARAYKWYVLAAKQGDHEAAKRRDIVAGQLAPKTILDVDGKVAIWKPKFISPEANEVTEPFSWDGKTASAAQKIPQASTLVSRAQSLLNKLGYDVGTPDGLAGEKTRAGVKRFQERNGLSQTGEITIPLVTQLEALAS
ncbi:MAG: SEL1-like repeat protein, partial [Pseudomonadota bacterium]